MSKDIDLSGLPEWARSRCGTERRLVNALAVEHGALGRIEQMVDDAAKGTWPDSWPVDAITLIERLQETAEAAMRQIKEMGDE